MSYTEKYCAEIPLVGPAAQHFVGLCLALSGSLSKENFEKFPEDVRQGILADIAELSSEEDPVSFMSDVRGDHEADRILSPAEARHASITLFENDADCMADYQDNQAFTLMRDCDQLFVSHVEGYSFSSNLSTILCSTLQRYAQDTTVTIRYAVDGESIKTDSFGGGAIAISKEGIRSFDSREAEAFAALLLTGDENGQAGQYQDQRNLVSKLLDGLTGEEQMRLLGTLTHVIQDLAPVVAERLEHERDAAVSDFSPS